MSVERRQVFEVPQTRAHVTEHQLVKLRCSCGCRTKAPAPTEATAPACYGPGVRALAVVPVGLPARALRPPRRDLHRRRVDACSVGAIKAMVAEAGGGWACSSMSSPNCSRTRRRCTSTRRADASRAACTGSTSPRPRSTPSSLPQATWDGGHGRHRRDRQDARRRRPRRLEAYRAYEVVHALCNAHHLRDSRACSSASTRTGPTR